MSSRLLPHARIAATFYVEARVARTRRSGSNLIEGFGVKVEVVHLVTGLFQRLDDCLAQHGGKAVQRPDARGEVRGRSAPGKT